MELPRDSPDGPYAPNANGRWKNEQQRSWGGNPPACSKQHAQRRDISDNLGEVGDLRPLTRSKA